MKRCFGLGVLACVASACAVRVPPPAIPPGAPDPDRAWAAVLSRFVDGQGRIDFAGLAKAPGDLEAYVAWLARVSPASDPGRFPTPDARLAYSINAYNALAMYAVLRSGAPGNLSAVRGRLFSRNSFALGGAYTSLDGFADTVIRPAGDARVHAALNFMARGSPRLPREPFRAELLAAELQAVSQYFFGEERNVRLDAGRQIVRFSQILEFYSEDFLKKAPSLIAYANAYREEKIPEGWKVEFIPFDWRLNSR